MIASLQEEASNPKLSISLNTLNACGREDWPIVALPADIIVPRLVMNGRADALTNRIGMARYHPSNGSPDALSKQDAN